MTTTALLRNCISSANEVFTPEFLEKFKHREVNWGPVGKFTAVRTYCRPTEDHFTESWYDVCKRTIGALIDHAEGAMPKHVAEELFQDMYDMKCTISGRSLWQLGTETVEKNGGGSLDNCQFIPLNELEAFCFLFDALMLGEGVGVSIERKYVYKLPPVKENVSVIEKHTKDADFIVPDSREGWVELIRKTLDAYFVTGKSFTYSTVCVRPKGSPIGGFGGVASGPEVLVQGIKNITMILNNRAGSTLRTIDALDIGCILGEVVVSGNVRRSAIIMIGDPDDVLFLQAKRFDMHPVPNWRSQSNNSINCNDSTQMLSAFWDTYKVQGEPYGLVNLKLARSRKRIIDGYNPSNVLGVNPCAEICLEPYEPCNLAEIHAPNLESPEDFYRVAKNLVVVCKIIASIPRSNPKTDAVIRRNMRMGISITGQQQALDLLTEDVLDSCYRQIKEQDEYFSEILSECLDREIPLSTAYTTVKPSGTASLLSGVSPGSHQDYSKYYIRRIRVASTSPLIARCVEAGYNVTPVINFDGTPSTTTSVVEFPVESRGEVRDMSAVEQLDNVKFLQTYWSDNAVSCTIYYSQNELPEIQEWIKENYASYIKSISFLQKHDHGFAQAVLETITEEKYREMTAAVKPLDLSFLPSFEDDVMSDCDGGACPVR